MIITVNHRGRRTARAAFVAANLSLTLLSFRTLQSQAGPTPRRLGSDSVVVVAGDLYRAGSFHRALLGDNYRDAWTTPIKVPVLDLKSFAGGLTPTKEGGGAQTKSLRFDGADGSEWVFRSVRKEFTILPQQYKGTIIWYIVRDEGSASHPTGGLAAAPMLARTNIVHPTPTVAVMPNDPALGKFQKEYGGMLGTLEEYPAVPKKGRGFPAGADDIIDSDKLLENINTDPREQIDQRQLLTAVMMDMLLGDNDRHPDQWKWIRTGKKGEVPWEPLPRDRDKVFVSYEGLILKMARLAQPSLIMFGPKYPDPTALFANAGEFDRRALSSLDRFVWDSVANSVKRTITDDVIDRAMMEMPPEYAPTSQRVARALKARRDALPAVANKYYGELWKVADIHATDADDEAMITRSGDGIVDVSIQSGGGTPYFQRRFDARDTKEIRIYLHGGNDKATVQGMVRNSILVRVIGGNGSNSLVDLSTVGGRRNPTRFYDAGTVTGVKYARDTVDILRNLDNAFNHEFNRRPWLHAYGTLIPPQVDRGYSIKPVVGIHSQRGLGYYPVIGAARYNYGFRDVPYSSMVETDLGYSTASNRMRIRSQFDKRVEESDTHFPVTAHMSQFEVVQFHGFGNDVPDLRGRFYDVRERQWEIRPAIGRSLSPVSDISLGPIVRYTTTDSLANRFIAQLHPYGFTKFGQAGMQLRARIDSKWVTLPDTLRPRFVLDVAGTGYPGMWDLVKPYESLDAFAEAFFTLPAPKKPVLALRAGGKKLWGPFPYFDAAFLGGSETFRTEEKQRYAGDASVYGTSELRVPIAKFPFIVPLDVGALGFVDMGRVYVNGQSPGGWQKAAGAGFWVGFLDPGKSVNVLFTNRSGHKLTTSVGFAL
jgi:hypothetical protein